jgi:hypothetical protein
MRTLMVYYSKFGNTRRIAEALAETMRDAGDARLIAIDQLTGLRPGGGRSGRGGQPHARIQRAGGGPLRARRPAAGGIGRQARGRLRHHGQALAVPASEGLAQVARPPDPPGRQAHRPAGNLLRRHEGPAADRRNRHAARRRARPRPAMGTEAAHPIGSLSEMDRNGATSGIHSRHSPSNMAIQKLIFPITPGHVRDQFFHRHYEQDSTIPIPQDLGWAPAAGFGRMEAVARGGPRMCGCASVRVRRSGPEKEPSEPDQDRRSRRASTCRAATPA